MHICTHSARASVEPLLDSARPTPTSLEAPE